MIIKGKNNGNDFKKLIQIGRFQIWFDRSIGLDVFAFSVFWGHLSIMVFGHGLSFEWEGEK